ncbi:unnamed protein product [Echinostoma caproni]|uniref:ANK_REP_REGION domain-containing protein n=1 Tax=Echinostoma caproni TaxID=27848 RepID=A0A183B732_9TREM|nr:unnamed protein product [Echinostoma caproni]
MDYRCSNTTVHAALHQSGGGNRTSNVEVRSAVLDIRGSPLEQMVKPDRLRWLGNILRMSPSGLLRYTMLADLSPPINVNTKCESGNTALHVAVSQNNVEIAKLLLETGGATVDVVNSIGNGATPLHMAAMFGI